MLGDAQSTQEKQFVQDQNITVSLEKYGAIDEVIKGAGSLSDTDKLQLLLALHSNPIVNKETNESQGLAQIPFKFIIELGEKEFNHIILKTASARI